MYLWDANILRHFGQGHPTLQLHLLRVPWSEIARPSVVVAEVLRGRCDFALKASPAQAPQAHERLQDTLHMLTRFRIVVFDQTCANVMERLRQRHRRRKRYADLMISAMAITGRHVLVSRNQADFVMCFRESSLSTGLMTLQGSLQWAMLLIR
jgi:predicted nucleic acid-binding protein